MCDIPFGWMLLRKDPKPERLYQLQGLTGHHRLDCLADVLLQVTGVFLRQTYAVVKPLCITGLDWPAVIKLPE